MSSKKVNYFQIIFIYFCLSMKSRGYRFRGSWPLKSCSEVHFFLDIGIINCYGINRDIISTYVNDNLIRNSYEKEAHA
jgi:hypothetical protein